MAIIRSERAGENVIFTDDAEIGIPIETAKLRVAEYAEENAIEVTWPTPAKKKKIDKLARLRPEKNRNWPVKGDNKTPFDFKESITVMQDENERHGLGRDA
jgi:hypothetical protein